MPYDGQLGTAKDGTPVAWSAQLGRAVPVAQAKALGVRVGGAAAPVKASQEDRKRVSDMEGGLDMANNLAGLAGDFEYRNKRTRTGGLLAIPGAATVAKALPFTSPDLSSMDRDSMQMATALRAPNMRLTQMEFQKFLGGVPSVKNSTAQNAENIQNVKNAQTYQAAKASYFSKWLAVRGSLDGADVGWMQFQARNFTPDGRYRPAQAPGHAAANDGLKARSGRTGPVLLGIEQ